MIDFLNIEKKNISEENFVVFYGKSGTGKSTYLDFFMSGLGSEKYIFLFHKDKKIIFKKYKQEYIFIDEIVNIYGLYVVYRYLLAGKKVFIATHIHPIIYKILFGIFIRGKYFFTDKNNGKIEQTLKIRGYYYDNESIELFISKFGGNFIELDIVLNHSPGKRDFGEIIKLFIDDCRIEYTKNKQK